MYDRDISVGDLVGPLGIYDVSQASQVEDVETLLLPGVDAVC